MAILSLPATNCSFNLRSFPMSNGGHNGVIRSLGVPSLRKGAGAPQIMNSTGNGPATAVVPIATTETVSLDDDNSTVTPLTPPIVDPNSIKRSDFPADFMFGAGTSAVQTEGAYDKHGKGLSVWDQFTHDNSAANADVAVDSYNRYKEDIELLKHMGVKTYRFSIGWPRILPNGQLKGGINQAGIDHYNTLINELISNGITPFVTLFHFDSPQALQNEYGGFLSRRIINDFRDYCDICFEKFGDRVKHWTLVNEPSIISQYGYGMGVAAPGRGSLLYGKTLGDSAREPYVVDHNLLLAHAAGSRLYKEKYYATQGGEIGIAFVGTWFLPYSDSLEDQEATDRVRDFNFGCYLGPLFNGEYPTSLKYLVKDRLPTFTDEEKEMLKGSADFVGINYYTTNYVRGLPITSDPPTSYAKDWYAETLLVNSAGIQIGADVDGSNVRKVYPDGLREVLVYCKEKYNVPKLYVTENGITTSVAKTPDYASTYRDRTRVKFMKQHIHAVKQAIDEGANVKGYFYWSLMDSFEFGNGYDIRFGLNFTNFDTLEREPNYSAECLADCLIWSYRLLASLRMGYCSYSFATAMEFQCYRQTVIKQMEKLKKEIQVHKLSKQYFLIAIVYCLMKKVPISVQRWTMDYTLENMKITLKEFLIGDLVHEVDKLDTLEEICSILDE